MSKKGRLNLFQLAALFPATLLWAEAASTQSSYAPLALAQEAKQRLAEQAKQQSEEPVAALLGMAMVYGGFSAEDVTKAALVVAAKQKTPEEN